MSLSSKARGKQRADDSHPDSSIFYCNVRFTSSAIADVLAFPLLNSTDRVIDVKRAISNLRNIDLTTTNLKLICFGRVLSDNVLLKAYLRALIQHQSGAAAANDHSNADEPYVSTPSSPGGSKATAFWLNCAVSERLSDESLSTAAAGSEEEIEDDGRLPPPLTGFDRLREAGFSVEEIHTIRQDFHARRRAALGGDAAAEGDEVDLEMGEIAVEADHVPNTEHARALEEQWMEGGAGNEALDAACEPQTYLFAVSLLNIAMCSRCRRLYRNCPDSFHRSLN